MHLARRNPSTRPEESPGKEKPSLCRRAVAGAEFIHACTAHLYPNAPQGAPRLRQSRPAPFACWASSHADHPTKSSSCPGATPRTASIQHSRGKKPSGNWRTICRPLTTDSTSPRRAGKPPAPPHPGLRPAQSLCGQTRDLRPAWPRNLGSVARAVGQAQGQIRFHHYPRHRVVWPAGVGGSPHHAGGFSSTPSTWPFNEGVT